MPDSASVSSIGTSFGGSAAHSSGARGLIHEPAGAGQDEGFEESSSLQQGVFGVLYTVSKEHKATLRFAVSRLVLDFWQLWLLVVNPAYGFDINVNSKLWKAMSLVQLDWIFADRGYTFFLIVLYMLLALLAFNVLLSMWVAYQFSNNRFDQVWPIAFLRWFGLIFFQVLDIATLTLLLGTLDCHYMGGPPQLRYYNALFPEVYCWSMPHLVHVAVSVVGLLVFEVMASAMVLSQMDLNPLSRQPLAIMHSSTEGLCFGLKSIAAIAAVMLAGDVRWLAVLYMAVFAALLYLQLKWVPATYAVVNYARCATYGCVLYCSALLCVLAFMTPSARQPERRKEFQHQVTLALWIGMGPAALAGMAACWARLHYFCVVVAERFRTATPGLPSKYICKFEDAREVGVALRACRDWIPGDEDTLKPEAMALGEVIVKAGIMQLPSDPRMTLLYSSFLIDVQGSYQSGYTQLQAAKQQSPGLLDRFAIFSREQEHTQKASGVNGAGDGVVDLVSYVEFQRSHRLVTRAHKEALLAMRAFWSLLLHSRVSFMRLTHAINRIEVSIRSAERAYQSVLTRHGHNARLVRLYGRFLESVKFDPWAAAKWFTEADRLEEREEHAKEAMQLGGALVALGATAGGGGAMAVDGLAALFINSQGIIQVATPEVHALLGYAKGELKDRDVACIMPPPFGDRHNAYLRNYIQTGVSHVLDRTTDFVALTKTRSVAPIRLRISKVSGLSEDSVFMGVMEPLPPQPGVVRAWVMGNGGGTAGATGNTLIAAEEGFYDWLGYGPGELLGQPLSALVNDAPTVDVVIKDLQQALLTPPIATKATATAAAAVAAGRSRRRTMDPSGAGLQHAAGTTVQHGQPTGGDPNSAGIVRLGSSSGLGEDGGGDGHIIGGGGGKAGTATQLVGGFNLAALLLARDTYGNAGGNTNESRDGPDHSAAGFGSRHIDVDRGERRDAPRQPTATLPLLEWRHKYSGSIPLTTILTADAFGSVRYVVISLHTDPNANGAGASMAGKAMPPTGIDEQSATGFALSGSAITSRRPPSTHGGQGALESRPQLLRSPAVFSELMLVADGKGRLLHVTAAMAAALGRSVESVRNAGLAALMPEPYGLIHRPWMHLLAVPPGKSWGDNVAATAVGHGAPHPPPYSCRSGVTLSLCGYDESEGPVDVPFRMRLQQRLSTTPKGPGRVHVMAFERRTRNQAMAERRMRLTVDLSGTITAADPAPASLFGVDPRQMVGRSLADLVDVFQLAAQVQGQQQQEQERREQTQGQQLGADRRKDTGSGTLEQQEAPVKLLASAPAVEGRTAGSQPGSMRRTGTLARADSRVVDLTRLDSSGSVVAQDAAASGVAAAQLHPSSVADDSPLAVAGDDPDKLLTLLMLELSKRGSSAEGMSWRVGVSLPADDSADAELQRLRAALGDKHVAAAAAALGAKVVPAVMVVRMVRRPHATAPAASSTAYPTRMPGGGSAYPGGGGLRSGASLAFAAPQGGGAEFQPQQPYQQQQPLVHPPAQQHSGEARYASPASMEEQQAHQQQHVDRLLNRFAYTVLGTAYNGGDGSDAGLVPGSSSSSGQVVAEATDGRIAYAAYGAHEGLPPPPGAPLPPAPPPAPPHAPSVEASTAAVPDPGHRSAEHLSGPSPRGEQSDSSSPADGHSSPVRSSRGTVLLPPVEGTAEAAVLSKRHSQSASLKAQPQASPYMQSRPQPRNQQLRPVKDWSGNSTNSEASTQDHSQRSPHASPPPPPQPPQDQPAPQHLSTIYPSVDESQQHLQKPPAQPFGAQRHTPQQTQEEGPGQQPGASLPSRSMRCATPMPSPQPLAAAGHHVHAHVQPVQPYLPPSQQPPYPHISAAPPAATARYMPSLRHTHHPEPVWSPQQQRPYHQQPWQPAPQTQQAPALDAAALAPSLRLEVELWRADLLGGVLELDARGRVARVDPHDSLGRAGLILGSPSGGLLNANIATLLPLPPAGAAALLTMPQPAADTIGSRSAPVLRGALKHRSGDAGRSGVVGPPLVLTARHAGDCCEVQLRLQAVRRTGVDGGMYIVLRPHRPTPVQPGFVRWLAAGDAAGLVPKTMLPPIRGDPAGSGSGSPGGEGGGTVIPGALATSTGPVAAVAAVPLAPPAFASTPETSTGMHRGGSSKAIPARSSSRALAARVAAAAAIGVDGADGTSSVSPRTTAALKPGTSAGITSEVLLALGAAAAAATARPFTAAAAVSAAEPLALSPRARPASSMPRPNLTAAATQTTVYAAAAHGADASATSPGGGQEPPPAAWPGGVAASPAVVAATAAAVATLLKDTAPLPSPQRQQPSHHAHRSERRRPLPVLANGDVSAEAASAQRRHDLLARSRRGSQLSRVESWVLSSIGIDPEAQKHAAVVSPSSSRDLPGAVPAAPGSAASADAAGRPAAQEDSDLQDDQDVGGTTGGLLEDSSSSSSGLSDNQHRHVDADPYTEDNVILDKLEDMGGKAHGGGDGKAALGSPQPAEDGAGATQLREDALLDSALHSNQGRGGGGGSGSEVGSDASGVGTAFGAGKRFKRLYRLLMGPPSQAHSSRLWWRLLAVVGAILVIHTITFAVMVSRLNLQLNDIRELNDVGAAAARMHDIAINARTLATLYATHTDAVRAGNAGINASSYNFTPAAGIQVFGEDLAIASRRVLAQMEEMTLELKELQQDIFLGKRKSLRMPIGFGFRDIWELPRLPVVDFYNRNDNITGQLFSAAGYSSNGSLILEPELIRETVPMGLWRASNLFVAAALELAETAEAYVAAGVDFSALASYNFVVYNGMDVLWPAYQDSIDAVVQITISNGRAVYSLMLIILAIEGVLIGVGAAAIVWYEAQQFTSYHYKLYTVFVLVPMALARGLANMSIELEPDHDDDDALLDANIMEAAVTEGRGADGGGAGDGDGSLGRHEADDLGMGGGVGAVFLPEALAGQGLGGDGSGAPTPAKPRTLRIQSAARLMEPPRPSVDLGRGYERKAAYASSSGGASDAEAVAAAAAAAVGARETGGNGPRGGGGTVFRPSAMSFTALRGMSRFLSFGGASIKVQPVGARAAKPPRRKLVASRRLAILLVLPFLAWSLVLVSIDLSVFATLNGNDGPIASLGILHTTISRLDRTLYYALDLAASPGNATGAAVAHAALSREILEVEVEYDVLLHGREALGWAPRNFTHRPHLDQETRGIVWSGHTVTNILYGEGQCLCFDPVECQPPTSPYYQLTSNGLHLLVMSLLKSGHSLLAQTAGGGSAAAGLNATEFRFIWTTLQKDGEEGMYRLINIYLKEVQRAYETAETKQIILFVLAVIWAVAFVWLQLRPFLRRARLEMRRIAELLSQLPPELEVEALMTRLVMSCSAKGSRLAPGAAAGAGAKKPVGMGGSSDATGGVATVADIAEAGPGGVGGGRRGSQLNLMNGGATWAGVNLNRGNASMKGGVGKWQVSKDW